MYADRAWSYGICSASIAVMALPWSVTRTCTVPKRLSTGSPSIVRVAPLAAAGAVDAGAVVPDVADGVAVPPDPAPPRGGAPEVGGLVTPEIGFVVSRDACVVLNDARAPRPMTVAMIAGAARRMSFLELESFEVDPVVRYPEVR